MKKLSLLITTISLFTTAAEARPVPTSSHPLAHDVNSSASIDQNATTTQILRVQGETSIGDNPKKGYENQIKDSLKTEQIYLTNHGDSVGQAAKNRVETAAPKKSSQ